MGTGRVRNKAISSSSSSIWRLRCWVSSSYCTCAGGARENSAKLKAEPLFRMQIISTDKHTAGRHRLLQVTKVAIQASKENEGEGANDHDAEELGH